MKAISQMNGGGISMKYKFNKYLLANKDESGNLIIFNTLSNAVHYIKKENYAVFAKICRQISENYEFGEKRDDILALLDSGIIYHREDDSIDDLVKEKEKQVFDGHKILTFILLPTEKCNFRCSYCYESHKGGTMNEATIDKVGELIDILLKDYDMLQLNWFGGEPLLAIDVMRQVTEKVSDICRRHRKSYYSSITTNGYFLTVDMMKQLLKMHVVLYQVTIDGNRQTHDRQRYLADGSGTYDTILGNLVRIKNEIRTATIRVIVRVNVPNSFDNHGIIELSKIFCDDKRFRINAQRIFKSGLNEETDFGEYLKVVENHKQCTPKSLIPEETICYAARNNTIMIRADGDVGKCTVNLDDADNQFGNINDMNLKEFRLNSLVYGHSRHLRTECMQCCIYPLCFGKQCPARRTQQCRETIEKYRMMVQNFSAEAVLIPLE